MQHTGLLMSASDAGLDDVVAGQVHDRIQDYW